MHQIYVPHDNLTLESIFSKSSPLEHRIILKMVFFILFLKISTSYFKYMFPIITHMMSEKVHNSSTHFLFRITPLELRIYVEK